MIYIAHRGNLNGPNSEKENHPDYIKAALKAGFQAEIDVWFVENKFILGHDAPQYEVSSNFMYSNNKLWCHAKNIETLSVLMNKSNLIHCFFHSTDACTITSQGWIWTYPGQPVYNHRAIAVVPERANKDFNWNKAGGVCSDFVSNLKQENKV